MPRNASIGGEINIGTRKAKKALTDFKADVDRVAAQMANTKAPGVFAAGGGGGAGRWTEMKSKIDLATSAARGAWEVGKKFFNMEEDLMQTVRQLAAVSDGTESIGNQLKALTEIGAKPGLTFEIAAKGSANLQALGLSSAESRRYMEQLGNEISRVGGNVENLDGFLLQMKQTLGKNKVEMQDFKIMAEHLTGFMEITKGLNRDDAGSFFSGLMKRLAEMPRAMRSSRQAVEAMQASMKVAGGLKAEESGLGAWIGQFATDMRSLVEDKGEVEDGLKRVGALFDLTESKKAEKRTIAQQRAQEEADRIEANANKVLGHQQEMLELELNLAAAKARGDDAAIAAAEDKLDIAKEAVQLAKTLEISEQRASEFIAQQNQLRRESEKAIKAAADEKSRASETDALGIDTLRARGRGRAADRREKAKAMSDEKARLMGMGYSPDEAEAMAGQKQRNKEDADYFERTGKRKIHGGRGKNAPSGLDQYGRSLLASPEEERLRGDVSNIPGFNRAVRPEMGTARQRIGDLKRERETLQKRGELETAQLNRLDAIKEELARLNQFLTRR